MEVAIIRGSTKETRAAILKSAMEVFLEVGYQEASMRKIAARAGITAGAIYKHFSGKEEMFDEIFEESGRKLMEVTESMIGIDFTAMSDDELLNVLYSRVSVQIFDMLEGDMQLFHMLLKNDSGKCLEKFRSNPRPSAWKANALSTELLPQFQINQFFYKLFYFVGSDGFEPPKSKDS